MPCGLLASVDRPRDGYQQSRNAPELVELSLRLDRRDSSNHGGVLETRPKAGAGTVRWSCGGSAGAHVKLALLESVEEIVSSWENGKC